MLSSAIAFLAITIFVVVSGVIGLILIQLIANKIGRAQKLKPTSYRFAWIPIYGQFVLSKLVTGSYLSAILIYGGLGLSLVPVDFIAALAWIPTLIGSVMVAHGISLAFGFGAAFTVLQIFFTFFVYIYLAFWGEAVEKGKEKDVEYI